MAAELTPEEINSYEALQNDLEEIINEMKLQMGRFPTQEEVVMFVWGSDKERDDILNQVRRDGS